jgi:hypothetical protein
VNDAVPSTGGYDGGKLGASQRCPPRLFGLLRKRLGAGASFLPQDGNDEAMPNVPHPMVRAVFGILISAAFLGGCAPSPGVTAATPPLAHLRSLPLPHAANHYGDDHRCFWAPQKGRVCRKRAV